MADIVQYWSSLSGSTSFSIGSNPAAQTFVASKDYTCVQLDAYLGRGYSVPESGDFQVQVSLYSVDGSHHPDSLLGVYGTATYDQLGAAAWHSFSGGSVSLNSGTEYAIVIEYLSKTGTRFLTWGNKGGYASGYGYNQITPGVWSAFNDWLFRTYEEEPVLSKPTNPTPADGSGPGVDFSGWTLSWQNGGGAETYNVYAGTSALLLSQIATGVALTSYTIPVGSPYRTTLLGHTIYWRVDAVAGEDTVTGDVWSFDPQPAAPTYTTPADEAADQTLHVGAEWQAATGATTYDFIIVEEGGLVPTIISDLAETDLANISTYLSLDYSTKYLWQVNAKNEFGTTEGATWWFRTLSLRIPIPSWELLPGKTLGPDDGGVAGVDFRWIGDNRMVTTKRLVAAAMNRIWYEEV